MGSDIHIGEILARNARLYPADYALIERAPAENRRREITWKEFDDAANRCANALIKKGIKKGDRVVHLMMNSIDWLIAYFGIVRTGAWAVPLNFRFTSDDIQHCVDTAEPKAMIFGEEFTERIDAIKDTITTIEHYVFVGKEVPAYSEPFEKILAASSSNPPEVEITYDDPCGLYFTSGTTGRPKAILLTHKNMVCACITENVHHYQTKRDTFILIPPLYHAGAKMHWFGSFIVGGRAVILKGVTPEFILEAVSEEQGTIVWLLVPWAQDILVKFDSGEIKAQDYDLSQ